MMGSLPAEAIAPARASRAEAESTALPGVLLPRRHGDRVGRVGARLLSPLRVGADRGAEGHATDDELPADVALRLGDLGQLASRLRALSRDARHAGSPRDVARRAGFD